MAEDITNSTGNGVVSPYDLSKFTGKPSGFGVYVEDGIMTPFIEVDTLPAHVVIVGGLGIVPHRLPNNGLQTGKSQHLSRALRVAGVLEPKDPEDNGADDSDGSDRRALKPTELDYRDAKWHVLNQVGPALARKAGQLSLFDETAE